MPSLAFNAPYNRKTITIPQAPADINFYTRLVQLPNIRLFGLQTPIFNPFAHMEFTRALSYIQQHRLVSDTCMTQALALQPMIGRDIEGILMLELASQHQRQNETMASVVNENLSKYPGKNITITGKSHIDEFSKEQASPIMGMKDLIRGTAESVIFDIGSKPSPELLRNTHVKSEDGVLKADYRFIFTNKSVSHNYVDKIIPAPQAYFCSIM